MSREPPARRKQSRMFCYWTEDPQPDADAWRTDCDNLFQFNADGPKENGFTFCPYCGSPLKVKR